MKYGEKQNEIFRLIRDHIGLSISYLKEAKILPYIINIDNEYEVKRALLTVCSNKENLEERKSYFVRYINVLMRKKK